MPIHDLSACSFTPWLAGYTVKERAVAVNKLCSSEPDFIAMMRYRATKLACIVLIELWMQRIAEQTNTVAQAVC